MGASGDLAPLSHLALGLLGEGQMWSPKSGWADANLVNAFYAISLLNGFISDLTVSYHICSGVSSTGGEIPETKNTRITHRFHKALGFIVPTLTAISL